MMLRNCFTSFLITLLLPFLFEGVLSQSTSSQEASESRYSQSKSSSTTKSAATPKQTARQPARVPIRQARPTRDRYREIQQALADAGHYSEAIDGIWGERSEAALKKYQEEEGLNASGKLDARTLIQLGLGPQYDPPEENASAASAPSPG